MHVCHNLTVCFSWVVSYTHFLWILTVQNTAKLSTTLNESKNIFSGLQPKKIQFFLHCTNIVLNVTGKRFKNKVDHHFKNDKN